MRDVELLVLEMERQGQRLHGMLRVGHLNTMTRKEFLEMIAVVDRLRVNLTDFNVLQFGPKIRREKRRKAVVPAQ